MYRRTSPISRRCARIKTSFCAEAGGLLDDATKQRNLAFRQRFQEENNVDVKLYAPYVYDATMILVEAMKKANSTDLKFSLVK